MIKESYYKIMEKGDKTDWFTFGIVIGMVIMWGIDIFMIYIQ